MDGLLNERVPHVLLIAKKTNRIEITDRRTDERAMILFFIGAICSGCLALLLSQLKRKRIKEQIDGIRKIALGEEVETSSDLGHAISSLQKELNPTGQDRPVLVDIGWYGASIDALPIGIIFADSTGDIVHKNPAAKKIFGSYNQQIDATITELIEVSLTGVQLKRELSLNEETDQKLKFISQPVEIETQRYGVVIAIQDISEQERLDATRRDFVANISHELKTPIGAMVILSETLQAEEDKNLVLELSERIAQEAHRLAGTIDDLSQLSQIEHGSKQFFEITPITYPVHTAIARASSIAKQKGVDINLTEDEDLYLLGDHIQITSAIYNLLDNAIKYTEEGTGKIDITIQAKENNIEVMISDNGIGIPESSHNRVFERFYRVDPSRSRESGGTGLGLAIVRHVVLNHDGKISLDSKEGQGTSFTISLPQQKQDQIETNPTEVKV